jgi:hypothetical protein
MYGPDRNTYNIIGPSKIGAKSTSSIFKGINNGHRVERVQALEISCTSPGGSGFSEMKSATRAGYGISCLLLLVHTPSADVACAPRTGIEAPPAALAALPLPLGCPAPRCPALLPHDPADLQELFNCQFSLPPCR